MRHEESWNARPTIGRTRSPLRVRADEVRAFLLDHRSPTDPATLRAAGLAAYAYVVLPAEDPRREALRPDYLRALRRHQRIRPELARLLQAWNDEGIEPLLFKGFHLAEFVYPSPGMRFHGDVDLLVRPELADVAVATARRIGWGDTHRAPWFSHEVCGLFGREGTKVDLHRYILHRRRPWSRPQRRVTEAVWADSERVRWAGRAVWLPAPVDALLVGLILQRVWCDDGYLKPHDPIDARLLSEEVTRTELESRARELRCEGTLAYFLDRCDPDGGRLALAPSSADRRRLRPILRRERGWFTGRHRTLRRLIRAPGLLLDMARVFPVLVSTRRRVLADADLGALFRRATPRPGRRRTSRRRRHRTVRAIRWAIRLFRLNPRGDCVLRSVAIYSALRRQGWPVSFVSGVRREGGRLDGHAWVEFEGRVLPELSEPSNRAIYRETFRWPPERAGERGRPGERAPTGPEPR